MSEITTGGTAFPGLNAEFTGLGGDGEERYEVQPSGGMTLRDYFAAKALNTEYVQHPNDPDWIAKLAYQVADAMLRARNA